MIDEDAEVFRRDLTALIPQMRAFAIHLCGDRTTGDDLAQDALLKAWRAQDSYTPGTNLKAWVFVIVRNQFLSERRRSWRSRPLDETLERSLTTKADPESTLALDEVRRALAMMDPPQREALILVGAGGLSYEEVADMVGCAVGTIKSRVSRARDRLAAILAEGDIARDPESASDALPLIIAQLETLQRDGAAAA